MRGYRADMDANNDRTGRIVETGGGGSLGFRGQVSHTGEAQSFQVVGTLGEDAGLRAILRSGDWNEIYVVARGNTITQMFNGRLMSMLIDDVAENRSRPLFLLFSASSSISMLINRPLNI